MDTSRDARFSKPGHKMTGDRRKLSADKKNGPGYDFIHAIIDDHSRLGYAEIHSDEKAQTVTGFTEPVLADRVPINKPSAMRVVVAVS